MDIKEIINSERRAKDIIKDLKNKTVVVPSWSELEKQYNKKKHPVFTDKTYKDKAVTGKGIERVTRIAFGWQKLAVKRMTELIFGIPVRRVYRCENDDEKRVSEIMEAVFNKNRTDSLNIERGRKLFASCEVTTIWYTQEAETYYAGEKSELKLRCKNFSPMDGETIYPLFDEFDDMIALSVEYVRQEDDNKVTYFDTYTSNEHIRWRTEDGNTTEELRESYDLGKINGVYINREEPIWEDESDNVYEAEWTLSRNGNYIRKNARPNWVIFSDEKNLRVGGESNSDNEGRNVLRYGKDDKAGYVSWEQAIDSVKFHISELKRAFFTQLQLPDMSMEEMKATPMSGEARKMVFIDSQLKVIDETGLWLEFFDREINVVRAFMKKMFPKLSKAIDSIAVEIQITPYQIRDEAERITNLTNATGGKAIMSQKTAISNLGYVEDVDEEMKRISDESSFNLMEEPTI